MFGTMTVGPAPPFFMSYIEKNLVPGEKLLYQTRHHWIVLVGPMFFGLLLGAFGVWLLSNAMGAAPERGTPAARPAASASIPPNVWAILGAIFLVAAIVVVSYGAMKRNATAKWRSRTGVSSSRPAWPAGERSI